MGQSSLRYVSCNDSFVFCSIMSSCNSYSFKSESTLSDLNKNDDVNKAESVNERSEFGNFQETYNWVECESVYFSGKPYFFNVRTLNSTWKRPVSKHVRLRRYNRKSKIFDNDFTPDIEIPLILSSESEKDDYECIDVEENEENEEKKRIHKNSEILARMYYGSQLDQFSCINGTLYFNDYIDYFTENLYDKNDSKLHEATNEDEDLHEVTVTDKSTPENSSIVTSNFLQVELSTSEDVLDINKKIEPINEDDSSVDEKVVAYSTSNSDDEKKENKVYNHYNVPRLKKLKSGHLLNKNIKKGKRKRLTKKRIPLQEKKLQQTKIIREVHGTTTISYDPVEPELPPGAKRINLSDTSSEEETNKSVSNNWNFFNIDSYVVNLSSESSSNTRSNSSSSSSSTCSCSCSCCSSSSSTTNKSSNSKRKIS